jgi:hypothetical protein
MDLASAPAHGAKENNMKKQAYMIAAILTVMIVAGVSNVKAQSSVCDQLKANIPFSFNIGNKTLPAGEYTVRCANPVSDMKVLQVRSSDGRTSAMINTSSVSGKEQDSGKLVFNRYGNQYFFSQAWLPADNTGMQAAKSRGEQQTARELAANKPSKEVVAITARR